MQQLRMHKYYRSTNDMTRNFYFFGMLCLLSAYTLDMKELNILVLIIHVVIPLYMSAVSAITFQLQIIDYGHYRITVATDIYCLCHVQIYL